MCRNPYGVPRAVCLSYSTVLASRLLFWVLQHVMLGGIGAGVPRGWALVTDACGVRVQPAVPSPIPPPPHFHTHTRACTLLTHKHTRSRTLLTTMRCSSSYTTSRGMTSGTACQQRHNGAEHSAPHTVWSYTFNF
jgi:hypothetical protein